MFTIQFATYTDFVRAYPFPQNDIDSSIQNLNSEGEPRTYQEIQSLFYKDIPRTDILFENEKQIAALKDAADRCGYYQQGDLDARNFILRFLPASHNFTGIVNLYENNNDDEDEVIGFSRDKENIDFFNFTYLNDNAKPAACHVVVRKDNPTVYVISFVNNALSHTGGCVEILPEGIKSDDALRELTVFVSDACFGKINYDCRKERYLPKNIVIQEMPNNQVDFSRLIHNAKLAKLFAACFFLPGGLINTEFCQFLEKKTQRVDITSDPKNQQIEFVDFESSAFGQFQKPKKMGTETAVIEAAAVALPPLTLSRLLSEVAWRFAPQGMLFFCDKLRETVRDQTRLDFLKKTNAALKERGSGFFDRLFLNKLELVGDKEIIPYIEMAIKAYGSESTPGPLNALFYLALNFSFLEERMRADDPILRVFKESLPWYVMRSGEVHCPLNNMVDQSDGARPANDGAAAAQTRPSESLENMVRGLFSRAKK